MDKNFSNTNNTSTAARDIWFNLNSYLKGSEYFLSLYKRAHNLSAAVFLVSNNMEESDRLKSKIKDSCSDLLSLTIKLKDARSLLDTGRTILEIENHALEVVSFLDIASISGSLSKMNTDIIKNEFNYLLSDLSRFKDQLASKNRALLSKTVEGEVGKEDNLADFVSDKNTEVRGLLIKDKKTDTINPDGIKRHNRKETRKNMIYDFILKHKNSSIKDIVPNIKGCSEKTVQREIMDLIKEGKVKKEGERRWSKYSVL